MKHCDTDLEVVIPYADIDNLTAHTRRSIATVAHQVFPGASVSLVEDPESILLPSDAIWDYPRAELYLKAQLERLNGDLPEFPETYLFLDIETHNAEKRWDMPLEQFFRLGQYAWGEGEVRTTESLDEVLWAIRKADKVIAHNGHSFDFSVLLGDEALHVAMADKLFDTYVFAELNYPCPVKYTHANGTTYRNNRSPSQFRRWFGLDNLAHQFGAARKFGDLAALAAEHNPEGTRRADLDFGLIPLDDPDFLAYADQDIVALRELTRSMLSQMPVDDYDRREQYKAALNAQMTRNGVLIDIDLAQSMIDEAEQQKQETLDLLVREYNFPVEGKMPWRTKAGKQAIERILADNGIDIHADEWPKTATGNPSLGGDALLDGTEGTDVASLGDSLAKLQGQRPLAAQTLEHTFADGRIHPDIDNLQRSGRASTTRPGLTTFGSRGDTRDKAYFLPDPGNVMVSLDLSNADARAVAFMSGDKNRAKWFEPGADSHEIVGRLMFGDETYDSDPVYHRNTSKVLNHGSAYGAGAKKMSESAGVPLSDAQRFLEVVRDHYPDVIRWQNKVREEGMTGWLTNHWGRTMPVESDRAYTQAPALMGQSSTTEVLYDGLIGMYQRNPNHTKNVCFTVHDEVILQAPEDSWQEVVDNLVESTKQTINGITFTLEHGDPAPNWREASH